MAKVTINPGICGLTTEVEIQSEDGQNVTISIDSKCPDVQKLGEQLKELDGFAAAFGPIVDSSVYQAASACCRHTACPVPMAIIKGIEVAIGSALPKDVEIHIE